MQTLLNRGVVSCKKQLIFGNWQLINLNSQKLASDKGWLAETELQFLTRCLQALPEHYAIIALHHHCLPSQSAWLDTMVIGNSAQLFAQLVDFPQVKVIMSGHVHQMLDVMRKTIRILGVPSTCFQFKPHCVDFTLDSLAPGYRVLQLYPTGHINTQIFRLPVRLTELETYSNGY
jgi:Icc protein